MKKYTLLLVIAVICVANSPALSQPSDPVAILKAPAASGTLSNEELHRKAEALRQLAWNGPESAVDAITPFLHDEKLATAARTALLNLPDGVGIAAMRQELAKLSGKELCGVVAVLGQAHDVKSVPLFAKMVNHKDRSVVKAVMAALGKIGDKAACDILQAELTATDTDLRQTAAVALLYAISNHEALSESATFADKLIASSCSEFVKTGAKRIAATDSSNTPAYIGDCLSSADPVIFKRGVTLAVKRQKLFDNATLSATWKTLSDSKRMKIYDAYTASARSVTELENRIKSGDKAKVVRPNPGTSQLLADVKTDSPLRLSALRCLGACCDDLEIIVKNIVPFLSSKNADEVQAAIEALSATPVGIDSELANVVKQGTPQAQIAALTVFANRPKTAVGLQAARESLVSGEVAARKAAYAAFALLSDAKKDDLTILFSLWNSQRAADEAESLSDAIFLVAKRTPEPAACCDFLLDQFAKSPEATKLFCFDVFAQMGNADALAAIVKCTQGGTDVLFDKATQVLGQWINLDAAAFLLEIAKTCPIEKYRIRALRGYIRLVRQMGQNAAQQTIMADAAKPLALRKDEKELLRQLYSRIESQRKDKLVFDGRTFNGWEGDTKNVFRIENGSIVAGSFKRPTARNEFLCTTIPYTDFTFTCECKILGDGGNAGIQFRSIRVPDSSEMSGYQADMTTDGKYWGSMFDESRRKKFLVKADPELIARIYKPNEWNSYKIVCWGKRIKLYLNDVLTADYTEKDDVPSSGIIGLQIHGGPPSEAWYRNIRIERYELIMTP